MVSLRLPIAGNENRLKLRQRSIQCQHTHRTEGSRFLRPCREHVHLSNTGLQRLKVFFLLFRFSISRILIEPVQQGILFGVLLRHGRLRFGGSKVIFADGETRLLHEEAIEHHVLQALIQLFQFPLVKGIENRHA